MLSCTSPVSPLHVFSARPFLCLLFGLALSTSLFGSTGGEADRGAQLAHVALARADTLWDERAGLLWTAPADRPNRGHGVRPTSWYALGLLWRDQPGDHERALQAFTAVLDQQLREPGRAWDGTFYRRAEEPRPPGRAEMWRDYDPNWRQFIGCVFAQALITFEDRLPAEMVQRMESAIVRALEGELAQGRLRPDYTNIAVMHGFLLGFAGQRLQRPEWIAAAEEWVGQIHREFSAFGTFEEYNSPTYYGVDLYGLALLRASGATPTLRKVGAEMEAELWRDIARFYHAGLRNLAGPYDRAYGMDLTDHLALTGLWIGMVVPAEASPLPPLEGPIKHGSDLLFAPCFVLLGAQVPAEVHSELVRFSGERRVERPIADGHRIATAWLGSDLMIGAQHTALGRGVADADSQFYPATAHWRRPDGGISWLALRECSRVNAVAEPSRLKIESIGHARFRLHAPYTDASAWTAHEWTLPGLMIRVDTDAVAFNARRVGDLWEIEYRDATQFDLHFVAAASSVAAVNPPQS